jgi:hypothetical protein
MRYWLARLRSQLADDHWQNGHELIDRALMAKLRHKSTTQRYCATGLTVYRIVFACQRTPNGGTCEMRLIKLWRKIGALPCIGAALASEG